MRRAVLAAFGAVAAASPAIAEAPAPAGAPVPKPLHVTVNPLAFAPAETLEEKLERRLRDADVLFRSICRGCGRREGLIDLDAGPFEPQRTLDTRKR